MSRVSLVIAIATAIVLALAWLPLALRFLHGWRHRRNPVSLAICAGICLFAYTNVLQALVLAQCASWAFFTVATHVFNLVVVVNFYVAFKWSERKFPDQRHARKTDYTIPPTNASKPTKKS